MQYVEIEIRGQGGEGAAIFTREEWDRFAPVRKVLAIHEQRRDLTAGQPYDILHENAVRQIINGLRRLKA